MLGMGYNQLKQTLMQFHEVTATQLDNGWIPHSVYCVLPYFCYQNQWLPQDFCKIGKTSSIANRARIYSQTGADVRVLWNIEVKNEKFVNKLEESIHNFCAEIHASKQQVVGTEVYNLSGEKSYDLLSRFVEACDLKNNKNVLRINEFINGRMLTYEVENGTHTTLKFSKRKNADTMFEFLFEGDDQ